MVERIADEQTMSRRGCRRATRASFLQTQVDLLMQPTASSTPRSARDLKLAQRPGVREAWEKDTGGIGSIDEWIAEGLRLKLDIDTSVSNLVLVQLTPSDDPKFAAEVANGFAKAYIDTTLALRTEPTARPRSGSTSSSRRCAPRSSRRRASSPPTRSPKGILADDARLDVESTRLAELSTQLLVAQNATYDAQPPQAGDQVAGTAATRRGDARGAANPQVAALKVDLGRVEARLEQESSMLGPNHPQYQRRPAEVAGPARELKLEIEAWWPAWATRSSRTASARRELQAALDGAEPAPAGACKDCRIEHGGVSRDVESAQRAYDTVLTAT